VLVADYAWLASVFEQPPPEAFFDAARAGEDEAIRETRSLLPLGTTRDVTAAACWVVARLVGEQPLGLVADVHDVWLDLPGRGLTVWPTASRDRCPHVGG